MGYVAYNITETSRAALLLKFPPRYERIVCHHVTVFPNVEETHALPAPAKLVVVGYASDENGLEALVVEVDGSHERPGGGIFHLTHSLAEGRHKVESNEVIAKFGWKALSEPVEIEAVACWNE